MEYVRQTINSSDLDKIVIPQALRNRKVQVIILPAEDSTEPKPTKRELGFAKGAEVPDSFFEPLPEEELKLWGQ